MTRLRTLVEAGDLTALGQAVDGKQARLADGKLQIGLAREGFLSVRGEDGKLFYGGNQGWEREGRGLRGRYVDKTGCGVIALANLSFYCFGTGQVPMDEYRERVRRVLRVVTPPVATPGALVRAAAKLLPGLHATILRSGRAGLEDALWAVAASLLEDRPVAMQIMGNRNAKAPGEGRAVPWHWTILTGLEIPASHPEQAVYTHSTWGQRRRGLFVNAWQGGRGPLHRTNLVFFTANAAP